MRPLAYVGMEFAEWCSELLAEQASDQATPCNFSTKAISMKFIIHFTAITAVTVAAASAYVASSQVNDWVIDFRDEVYSQCFGQHKCDLEFGTVQAYRINQSETDADLRVLVPAEIYWDFVDGFGVMGGKENDEIDPDEMLRISLKDVWKPKLVTLTDLFFSDTERDSAPAEEAIISGRSAERQEFIHLIQGRDQLPENELNQILDSKVFDEEGSLLSNELSGSPVAVAITSSPDQFESIDQTNGEASFEFPGRTTPIHTLDFLSSGFSNNDYSVATLSLGGASIQ